MTATRTSSTSSPSTCEPRGLGECWGAAPRGLAGMGTPAARGQEGQGPKRKGFSPKCGISRVAADGDFLHTMIRKAVEGKDINHKGQGRDPVSPGPMRLLPGPSACHMRQSLQGPGLAVAPGGPGGSCHGGPCRALGVPEDAVGRPEPGEEGPPAPGGSRHGGGSQAGLPRGHYARQVLGGTSWGSLRMAAWWQDLV